jgi:hypothetical protein
VKPTLLVLESCHWALEMDVCSNPPTYKPASPLTALPRREIVKMVILLPLVPFRMILVLILLLIVAAMNTVALLGW